MSVVRNDRHNPSAARQPPTTPTFLGPILATASPDPNPIKIA